MDKEYIEIQPEYVYMTIPAEYVCIYHKILVMFVDFGINLLKDCKAPCEGVNKQIISCFNAFHAALAAKSLNQPKTEKVLIKYVEAQIDAIYNHKVECPEVVFPVDEEGKIKAIVGCANEATFKIDAESGSLWAEYQKSTEGRYHLGEEDFKTD